MTTTRKHMLICPYCGNTQAALDRCRDCGGLFEPLSRQATHNAMGPWFVRAESRPFQPGCSYETMVKMVERGQVTKLSIVRGPTTRQFWTIARRVAGVAHLLGYCHNCDAAVDPDDHGCHSCGVPFGAYLDRNYLGLPEVKPLPWEAPSEEVSRAAIEPNRMVGFRPAGSPVGISSFASDEELRGGGLEPMPGRPAGLVSAPAFTGAALGAAPVDHAAEASRQAMQRRLAEQKRTIRTLAIVSAVMALVTVIIVAALALNQNRFTAPRDESSNRVTERNAQPAAPIADHPASNEAPELPATTVSADSQPASLPESGPALADRYRAAQERLAEARRTDRTRPERIADYELVIAELESMRSEMEGAELNAIEAVIAQAINERDRLKVEEFFP